MKIEFILVFAMAIFTNYLTVYADDSANHDVLPLNEENWPSDRTKSWQAIDRSLSQMKHFAKNGNLMLLRKSTRNMGIAIRSLEQEVYLEDPVKLSEMKHYLNKLTRSIADLSEAIKKEDADLINEVLQRLEVNVEKVKINHPPE